VRRSATIVSYPPVRDGTYHGGHNVGRTWDLAETTSPLADESLNLGNVDSLVELVIDETRGGPTKRFEHAMRTRDYTSSDVESCRKFVRAYVQFIHYVEGVYKAAHEPVVGHLLDDGLAPRKHGSLEPTLVCR
jgi:hypothetical protein